MRVSRGFHAGKDSKDKNFSAWDDECNTVKQNTSCKTAVRDVAALMLVRILKKICARCTCVCACVHGYI